MSFLWSFMSVWVLNAWVYFLMVLPLPKRPRVFEFKFGTSVELWTVNRSVTPKYEFSVYFARLHAARVAVSPALFPSFFLRRWLGTAAGFFSTRECNVEYQFCRIDSVKRVTRRFLSRARLVSLLYACLTCEPPVRVYIGANHSHSSDSSVRF